MITSGSSGWMLAADELRSPPSADVALTSEPAALPHELSHLRTLEAEAIHSIREVAAELERPLFSGGKDSIVLLHLRARPSGPEGFRSR